MTSVNRMRHYEFYTVMSLMGGFSTFIMIGLCGTAAWWLYQSKAVGSRLMLWGMMLQAVRLLEFGFASISYFMGYFNRAVEFTFLVWMVTSVGILLFAIGLFLQAKNQRGLQARVVELEHILADLQERR